MRELVDFVRTELAKGADPERAEAMARYLKTTDPFYGVPRPGLKPILVELKHRFPPRNAAAYEETVLALWSLPHREEKYLALLLAAAYPPFITFEALGLYERLITQGAWWDLVDDAAIRCVGPVWLHERELATPVMKQWIDHDHMWLRRSAIIGQLKHNEHTDEALLFRFCLHRAHEKEFFIRKAIGWALREYAKTAPQSVADFALGHRERLSGLSFREATKHLDV